MEVAAPKEVYQQCGEMYNLPLLLYYVHYYFKLWRSDYVDFELLYHDTGDEIQS